MLLFMLKFVALVDNSPPLIATARFDPKEKLKLPPVWFKVPPATLSCPPPFKVTSPDTVKVPPTILSGAVGPQLPIVRLLIVRVVLKSGAKFPEFTITFSPALGIFPPLQLDEVSQSELVAPVHVLFCAEAANEAKNKRVVTRSEIRNFDKLCCNLTKLYPRNEGYHSYFWV